MQQLIDRITLNPEYPVEMVLDLLSPEMTTQEIVIDYPAMEEYLEKYY